MLELRAMLPLIYERFPDAPQKEDSDGAAR
jgi:hypothetical protein